LLFSWQHAGAFLQANAEFALWQLMGPFHQAWACELSFACSPRLVQLWDLLFIGAYAYVLAWWATAAFARRAALRQLADHAPTWLNRLGWALPVAVAGDLAENLFTTLTLSFGNIEATVLGLGASVLMALSSAVKWAGLAGTLALIAWGWLAPKR
jgi:hypothetical protein